MTGFRITNILVALIVIFMLSLPLYAAEFGGVLDCKSAVLMEASTGKVLYEKNANEALPPASVTKIMTLLIVMEAIDNGKIKLSDMVSVSEHAASMGGSQVYLKVGEEMSVEEMIKSIVIASANDCAVALAEFVCGSEAAFVAAMNTRAKELGMANTNFENTNGLDDTASNHVISAMDIAIMSRELIKHELILKYSSTWMDTIRDGTFGLTNTNRLVRFYSGANGLKTGSTSKAHFCISATAKRDNMQLIAVIMAAPTRDIRNNAAKQLLDFGFSNFGIYSIPKGETIYVEVKGGTKNQCFFEYNEVNTVIEKEKLSGIEIKKELPETISCPIKKGSAYGRIVALYNGKELCSTDIYSTEDIPAIGYFNILCRVLKGFCLN